MGQWYFELGYFTARWLGFATRQRMPENAMNLSKQFVYMQQFYLVYFSVINKKLWVHSFY